MDLIPILITKKVQTNIIPSKFPEITFPNVFNLSQVLRRSLAVFSFPVSQDTQKALISHTWSINKKVS